MTRFLLIVALLCVISAGTINGKEYNLTVSTKLTPPFVLKEDGVFTGYSIELFEVVLKLLDSTVNYTFIECDGMEALLNSMKYKEANVSVSGLTATSKRAEFMDFSEELYNTGKQILTNNLAKKTRPTWLIFAPFSGGLWLFSAGMIVFVGLVLWILEHPYEEEMQGQSFVQGFRYSVWVTFQNFFGAGDFPFHSTAGKVFAVAWIIIATTFVSLYTANLASILTITKMSGGINGAEDLPGKRLGVVAKSLAYDWAKTSGAVVVTYSNIAATIKAVINGDVDAVVGDSPTLIYYQSKYPDKDIEVVGSIFDERTIAMAYSLDLDLGLQRELNQAILLAREQGYMDILYDKYFTQEGDEGEGDDENEDDDETESISLADVYKPFLILIGSGCGAAAAIRAVKWGLRRRRGQAGENDEPEDSTKASDVNVEMDSTTESTFIDMSPDGSNHKLGF
eukprot:GCRY01000660.1.p1 GENE.GCRY01000660.1~~GCRY01000660.1.p1  ORF type:complete len:452 (-),score=109.80 GCRY01000660.1:357-1712(-)